MNDIVSPACGGTMQSFESENQNPGKTGFWFFCYGTRNPRLWRDLRFAPTSFRTPARFAGGTGASETSEASEAHFYFFLTFLPSNSMLVTCV
jgi:hypothetical protein